MFDILKAKESFMNYVRQFDLTNDKIHLKLVHTLEVVHTTEYLCHHENITGVERDLAYLIALLHDIGRFEQIKRFNSFDDRNIDHAKLGVQVLFKEGMIRNFIDDDQYDEIIEKAIAYHSLYKIPNNLEPSLLKQVLLIRDSDKLDKGKEEVVKINDHAMDKIRYALMTDTTIHRTFDRELKLFSGKGARE